MAASPLEIAHFNQQAHAWWDTHGPLKTLHQVNPLRMNFIQTLVTLDQKNVLDVGCGGGILSEALAKAGATVTGLDLAEEALAAAKTHATTEQLNIRYLLNSVDTHAEQYPAQYDVVCCLEMLEHVIEPEQVLQACFTLLKPGGTLFLSTLNRTPTAYLTAIIAGEFLLNFIPRGTHDYQQFIRPSELHRSLRHLGFSLRDLRGITYNILDHRFEYCDSVDVNYVLCAQKPGVLIL